MRFVEFFHDFHINVREIPSTDSDDERNVRNDDEYDGNDGKCSNQQQR